jgi:molybdopterin/thiamine biosynthesis adenylyltransferase
MRSWQLRKRVFNTRPVKQSLISELNRSQSTIHGFDIAKYQTGHVVMIGAGGIGSHVAAALVRKGIGRLTLIDDDKVELKNCTRQLFDRHDVGKYKAVQLGRHLSSEGMFATQIESHPRRFQEMLERGYQPPPGAILIGGVDNNPTRRAVATTAREYGAQAALAAVSIDGNQLYVMVQEPGQACWGCAYPHYVNDRTYPCNLPGIIDVLQVVSGLMVFTVDSLLCGRHREWNVREVVLDGSMPDRSRHVGKRSNCVICGTEKPKVQTNAGSASEERVCA